MYVYLDIKIKVMTTFLLYTFLLVCLGILVRIFWIPLVFIGGMLFIVLGIIVCAGVTAFTLELINAILTDGTWIGFSTYFTYSAIFYTVMMLVYMSIISDTIGIGLDLLRKFIRKI